MSESARAFMAPISPAGSGEVKIYTQEEIAAVACSITPVNRIPLFRHIRTLYPPDGNLGVQGRVNKRELGR